MEKIGELQNNPEFKQKLARALQEPNGQEAHQIVNLLSPLVHLVTKAIDYSPGQRAAAVVDIYSYTQFYGCPSFFLTIAPDDTHSVLALRLTFPTNRRNHFPEVDDDFTEALCNGDKMFSGEIKIDNFSLQKLIASSPVAAASHYKFILESVFQILLGITPDHLSHKSYTPVNKGIYGYTRAAYQSTEVQDRLSLHAHMAIWASVPPHVIQSLATFEDGLARIKKVFSSYVSAEVPAVYHLKGIAHQAVPKKERNYDNKAIFKPMQDESAPHIYHDVVNNAGSHSHGKTCHKPPHGVTGCRMAYPQPVTTKDEKISVREIVPLASSEGNEKPIILEEFELHPMMARDVNQQPLPIQTWLDILENLEGLDRAVVMKSMYNRNGAIVDYSAILTQCLCCNNATTTLSSGLQFLVAIMDDR